VTELLTGVRSPCINVCRIDRRTGWCEGCRRTMAEISAWPTASEAERQAIVAALPARQPARRPWR
jgi:predicted Fe-S protein YdhL (DUF1289 family)